MTGDTAKHVADASAVLVAGATWIDWLPNIAAALSIIWLLMRIYDWIVGKLKQRTQK